MCPFRCVLHAYCNSFKDIIGWTHFPKEFLVIFFLVFPKPIWNVFGFFFQFSKIKCMYFWYFRSKFSTFFKIKLYIFDIFDQNFRLFQNKISKKPIPKVKKSKMETFSRIWPKSVRRGSGRKKSFIDSSSRTRFLSYGELLVCFGNFTGTNDSCWEYSCATR